MNAGIRKGNEGRSSIVATHVGFARLRCAAICLLASLSGCAHYRASPIDLRTAAASFSARRLTEEGLRDQAAHVLPQVPTEWPPQEWDRATLLAVALTQNLALAVARAEVGASSSREITVAALPNPDLTLQSEYARHDSHPWLYGMSLKWLLRSGTQRRLEIQGARLDTVNALWRLMDQAWAVRRELAASLSDWESARRRLRLLERLAVSEDKLLRMEQQRVELGEDAPVELINAQQARILIDQQRVELRQMADAAQAAVARALGMPQQALDEVPISWPDWGSPAPIDAQTERRMRERALLSRADLSQAIGTYAQAETKLQLSVARQFPEVVLGPGYYWDHGIARFPFDVGFAVPLNRNRGEIAEAGQGRELAAQRMLALQAEIYGEIAAAERAELAARSGTEAAERQLAWASLQKQHADLRFRVGASDSQEPIISDILLARAELEVLQTRTALQTSSNNLEDALHAPLSGPELALAESP